MVELKIWGRASKSYLGKKKKEVIPGSSQHKGKIIKPGSPKTKPS